MVTLNWPGVHAERLPVFSGKSEARHAADDALGVDTQGEFEVFLDFAEQLPGVDDFDGLPFESEILAQREDTTDVDAGDERAAEIQRNAIGPAVIEGAKDAFPAGSFRHGIWTSRLTVSRRGDIRWMMPKPTR